MFHCAHVFEGINNFDFILTFKYHALLNLNHNIVLMISVTSARARIL